MGIICSLTPGWRKETETSWVWTVSNYLEESDLAHSVISGGKWVLPSLGNQAMADIWKKN